MSISAQKKRWMIRMGVLFFMTVIVYLSIKGRGEQTEKNNNETQSTSSVQVLHDVASPSISTQAISNSNQSEVRATSSSLVPPIARAWERISLKPFGIQVSPNDSPVHPERFTGYHAGTDFETFPEEQDRDVVVSAICAGELLRAGVASGYGGYAVESCEINGEAVIVIYGHLKASSIQKKVGSSLSAGETFAILGKGYSKETDGERKHLHLGIVKGKTVNIRGYVSTKPALSGWLDYQVLMK